MGSGASADALARVLGVTVSDADEVLRNLPTTVVTGAPDEDAEALFHALHTLGAQVKLHRSSEPAPQEPGTEPPRPNLAAPDAPAGVSRPPSSSAQPLGSAKRESGASPLAVFKAQIAMAGFALFLLALGVAMIADPSMVDGTTSGSRRAVARILYGVLQAIWSRPAGAVFVLLGLGTGGLAWKKPDLFVTAEDEAEFD